MSPPCVATNDSPRHNRALPASEPAFCMLQDNDLPLLRKRHEVLQLIYREIRRYRL